jgi:hypothetical protein
VHRCRPQDFVGPQSVCSTGNTQNGWILLYETPSHLPPTDPTNHNKSSSPCWSVLVSSQVDRLWLPLVPWLTVTFFPFVLAREGNTSCSNPKDQHSKCALLPHISSRVLGRPSTVGLGPHCLQDSVLKVFHFQQWTGNKCREGHLERLRLPGNGCHFCLYALGQNLVTWVTDQPWRWEAWMDCRLCSQQSLSHPQGYAWSWG